MIFRVHNVQVVYYLIIRAWKWKRCCWRISSEGHIAALQLERLPDDTTILGFRQLLNTHHLGEALFAELIDHLAALESRLQKGKIGSLASLPVQLFKKPAG